MVTVAEAREIVRADIEALGIEADAAADIYAKVTDEQAVEWAAGKQRSADERQTLLARVQASPELRAVICPPVSWLDADARYDTARRALKLIEGYAEKAGAKVDDVVAAMAEKDLTIEAEIARHGEDPRTTRWGASFYGFRYRIQDGIAEALREERQAAALAKREAEDAAWAARGLARCERCDGVGGADHWPGWTCFDCDGRKSVPVKG